ncbi:hypothetical protein Q0F98_02620 [Paenibacillus amylolyticus]|nr:hypothetical protein Q0F98_02620 [Paenibacillus amylolyticus]
MKKGSQPQRGFTFIQRWFKRSDNKKIKWSEMYLALAGASSLVG